MAEAIVFIALLCSLEAGSFRHAQRNYALDIAEWALDTSTAREIGRRM